MKSLFYQKGSVRLTAITLALLAIAIYVGFYFIVASTESSL